MSIAYLNNISDIEESFQNLKEEIRQLKDKIIKYMENNDIYDKKPENPIQQLCRIKNKGKTALRNKLKILLKFDENENILNLENKDIIQLIQFTPTIFIKMKEKTNLFKKIQSVKDATKYLIKVTN